MMTTETFELSPGRQFQPPNVLVVDDESSTRQSLGFFLKVGGYRAIEAATVERAIQVLSTTRVNAAVLDVQLGGERSGLEVLTRLRLEPDLADIPVIILTGGFLTDEEEVLITHARAHVFYKPEGCDTLVRFLDDADTSASRRRK